MMPRSLSAHGLSHADATRYAKEHQLEVMFQKMMEKVLVDKPEDPREYLVQLMTQQKLDHYIPHSRPPTGGFTSARRTLHKSWANEDDEVARTFAGTPSTLPVPVSIPQRRSLSPNSGIGVSGQALAITDAPGALGDIYANTRHHFVQKQPDDLGRSLPSPSMRPTSSLRGDVQMLSSTMPPSARTVRTYTPIGGDDAIVPVSVRRDPRSGTSRPIPIPASKLSARSEMMPYPSAAPSRLVTGGSGDLGDVSVGPGRKKKLALADQKKKHRDELIKYYAKKKDEAAHTGDTEQKEPEQEANDSILKDQGQNFGIFNYLKQQSAEKGFLDTSPGAEKKFAYADPTAPLATDSSQWFVMRKNTGPVRHDSGIMSVQRKAPQVAAAFGNSRESSTTAVFENTAPPWTTVSHVESNSRLKKSPLDATTTEDDTEYEMQTTPRPPVYSKRVETRRGSDESSTSGITAILSSPRTGVRVSTRKY